MSAPVDDAMQLVVADRRMITPTVCRFEFRHPSGAALPAFTAGAHVTVQTPAGVARSYSLNNDDRERDRYVIAVKREDAGRGGSLSLHTGLQRGELITVSGPKSSYAFHPARRFLLIAGGIGITPMIAIFRRLTRDNADNVTLIYCTRTADDAPYRDELAEGRFTGKVLVHHSAAAGGRRFDFWPYFRTPDDTAIYYCGPEAMMNTIYALTIHWPRQAIHVESFAALRGGDVNRPFRVRRARDGRVFEIPAEKSVIDVLRDSGLNPRCSCESGTCGTCRVGLLAGVPDHRDLVLSQVEKTDSFMPCVSRAYGEELVLEI